MLLKLVAEGCFSAIAASFNLSVNRTTCKLRLQVVRLPQTLRYLKKFYEIRIASD